MSLAAFLLLWLFNSVNLQPCAALSLELTSAASIRNAASQIAYGMMKYYHGNETGGTPGILPQPYYWWETGAMFMHMVDYWYYTGDTTYNAATVQAMCFQGSQAGTFLPANQTATEGNDDQVFWAFAVMSAAELNFDPPESGYPSWLAMAQAVFNQQARRWDAATCGGGLRWQIYATSSEYNYKNSVANGGFFLLASRLARYTGNQTYVDWATREWEWWSASVLFDNATWQVNDGTVVDNNCSTADHTQWSYNYGLFIGGLAYLYNHTNDTRWLTSLEGLLNHTLTEFFPKSMGDDIMVEVACEPYGTCDTDQWTFKGHVLRWLTLTTQLVPSLHSQIWPYIAASGAGAAGQCDGGTDGITCGFRWNTTKWDGTYGVGQQMSALAAVGANMAAVTDLRAPFTANDGGTSVGDPSAGSTGGTEPPDWQLDMKITNADRAGAGVLTALAVAGTIYGAYFIVS